jgi:hypothetical protein
VSPEEADVHAFLSKLYAGLFAMAAALFGWLFRSTLNNREEILKLKVADKVKETRMATLKRELEDQVASLRSQMLTREDIRTAMDAALEKYDRISESRHVAAAQTYRLQQKEETRKLIDEITPRIVRELRGDSGKYRSRGAHPSHPGPEPFEGQDSGND